MNSIRLFLLAAVTLMAACNSPEQHKTANQPFDFKQWSDSCFEADLLENPMFLTRLGRKENYDQLNDISDSANLAYFDKIENRLLEIKSIDTTGFNSDTKLSYQLLREDLAFQLENKKFRLHNYPVNQMHGAQSELPSFMINNHKIDSLSDAKAYISRINGIEVYFEQLLEKLDIRSNNGISVPLFSYDYMINDCDNIMGNGTSEDHILYKDFLSKIEKLSFDESIQTALLDDLKSSISTVLVPSYQKLKDYLIEHKKTASKDDGVWKFPNGKEYYDYRLKFITTTDWSAEKIHQTGLDEVARIHGEMKDIMNKVRFKGDLKSFFQFMKNDDQFYYENGTEGKKKMIDGYTAIIDSMRLKLDELFLTKPKAPLVVKAVEAYREKSAGKAFYDNGSIDGSRPGYFYANLYEMKDMPTYEMEALAYHEGLPGHHMQISIAQEMTGIPEFRKHLDYTAYVEGWGLYCEFLPKEYGFYKNPYSDFGRLAMELWRACRLVVDAGIHAKKWTREEAIQYLQDNTPNSYNSCKKAIERYIVMPGQATAYKVGMIKILEIREKAKQAMGDKFDIKKFHDIFLLSGPVPLNVFEKSIDNWIKENS
jgi:uncharacterized protein (DUF885 family)